MKKYFSTYLAAVSIIALILVGVMNICHYAFGGISVNAAQNHNVVVEDETKSTTSPYPNEYPIIDEIVIPVKNEEYKPVPSDNNVANYYYMTDDDINDFASLLFLEAGAEPEEVKYAVASVILNRMTLWDMSFSEVAYQKNQFSPAYLIDDTTPRIEEINIVKDVLKSGPTIDKYVCYFRASYYHDWDDMNDYGYFGGNTYFSYSKIDYDRYCN